MAKFIYKTRGMSDPQGKPKVYFTCHPLDFRAYFETISDEILKSQNCAIWYDEELLLSHENGPDELPDPPEEFLSGLSEMQLLVVPVTSRFLYQECRARTLEFAYAVEHHIPVLPLMQEKGLESEFNRICGDLQFLDRDHCDGTTDSYEEKLRKFLSSVLVDDETAAKVRAAFDAYVFLSYRKKDRKYARDLMRLIHGNDFCRDIAIWYDEYLVPGENFNDAIRDAMEKSSLFALMVTPNLVNETNYVMTVEYPAARKAGKPVLPVEMEATDADSLKKNYADIPDCANPNAPEEIARRLVEHLKDIALKENDSDPQHLLFIGLAYLGGIDVEVDYARGLSLLEKSAGAGFAPAMQKLVYLYQTGEGVERDYAEAIRWQEKLVNAEREQYRKAGDEESGHRLFSVMRDLGSYLHDRWKIPEEKRVYLEMRELAEELAGRFGTTEAQREQVISLELLGGICVIEEKYTKAEGFYEKSLKLCQKLWDRTKDRKVQSDLAVIYDHFGDFRAAEGSVAPTTCYDKALEIRKQIYEETKTPEACRNLALSYEKCGQAYGRYNDYAKMEDLLSRGSFFQSSLELKMRLYEEDRTAETCRDLADIYAKLASLSAGTGGRLRKTYLEKEAEFREQLYQETGTLEACRDLAFVYRNLGDYYKSRSFGGEKDPRQAKACFRKSLELFERLREETKTFCSDNGLAHSVTNDLAIVSYHLGKLEYPQMNEACLREAEALWERLAETDFREPEGMSTAARLRMVRMFLAEAQNPAEGGTDAQAADESATLYSQLSEAVRLAGEARENADRSAAISHYQKGARIGRKLMEEAYSEEAADALAACYEGLGALCEEDRGFEEARLYYELYLDLGMRVLEKQNDAIKALLGLARGYQLLGELAVREKDPYGQMLGFDGCMGAVERLLDRSDLPKVRQFCASCYEFMAGIKKGQENLYDAAQLYTLAIGIREELCRTTGNKEDYDQLAQAYLSLARADEKHIQKKSAKRALRIWQTLLKAEPGNDEIQKRIGEAKALLSRRGR